MLGGRQGYQEQKQEGPTYQMLLQGKQAFRNSRMLGVRQGVVGYRAGGLIRDQTGENNCQGMGCHPGTVGSPKSLQE